MPSLVIGLFLVFTAGIAWLLWAPLRLTIDSDSLSIRAELVPLLRATVSIENAKPCLRMRVFFISFEVDVLSKKSGKKKKDRATQPSDQRTDKKSKERKIGRHKVARLLRNVKRFLLTFRFRHSEIDIDTGDFCLNAQLIPVFLRLSTPNFRPTVNFQGTLRLHLEVENRLANAVVFALRMLRDIRSKT